MKNDDRSARSTDELGIEELGTVFRRLAERLQDVIFRYRLVAPAGYEYVSPSVAAVTGFTPEEFYSDPDLFRKRLHPDDRHVLVSQGGPTDTLDAPCTLRWTRRDGTPVWLEGRAIGIRDATGEVVGVEGIFRDITEHVRMMGELRAAREAEAALREERARLDGARLAARAAAHGLNNDLTMALGALEMLCIRFPVTGEMRDWIEQAIAGIQTASANVNRIGEVTRIATRDAAGGPALDVERSVDRP